MALKHTYNIVITDHSGAEVLKDKSTYTADAEFTFDDQAAPASVKQIDCDVTKANIVSFYIESDQDVTLKLNVDDASVQVVELKAKKGFFWNGDQPGGNPILPSSISKLFFHNAGLVSANVNGGFLVDQAV